MNRKAVLRTVLKSRRDRRRMEEGKAFDSTPMGDLAFLLLIFFIVTSSFILREGIFFSLPSPSAGVVNITEDKVIEVYPKNTGFLYAGSLLSRDGFGDALKKSGESARDKIMIIHMSKDVKYERLVDTLSVARETGIRKVSLKNEDEG